MRMHLWRYELQLRWLKQLQVVHSLPLLATCSPILPSSAAAPRSRPLLVWDTFYQRNCSVGLFTLVVRSNGRCYFTIQGGWKVMVTRCSYMHMTYTITGFGNGSHRGELPLLREYSRDVEYFYHWRGDARSRLFQNFADIPSGPFALFGIKHLHTQGKLAGDFKVESDSLV